MYNVRIIIRTPAALIVVPAENASLFEFSLCLSRACLGKTIVLSIKWRKRCVFRTEEGEIREREVRALRDVQRIGLRLVRQPVL
eukprot:COSAG06_NODE_35027_length_465_cov_1.590164_1_plen_83_part_01